MMTLPCAEMRVDGICIHCQVDVAKVVSGVDIGQDSLQLFKHACIHTLVTTQACVLSCAQGREKVYTKVYTSVYSIDSDITTRQPPDLTSMLMPGAAICAIRAHSLLSLASFTSADRCAAAAASSPPPPEEEEGPNTLRAMDAMRACSAACMHVRWRAFGNHMPTWQGRCQA